MNAHTPFDAKQDWTNPYCQNSSNDPMVDALLGNAYHVVRTVYCNLGNLKLLYDFLNQYGMVLGVQSEAELKALTTKAKYARIYGFSRAGDRQVTDYLYVEGDLTGIIPDDSEATGSWITVATSGSNGSGTSSGEGAYIPWVYANGSATGGETTINVPDNTVGVPFIIINGDMQYVGRGFEFNVDNLSVTLAQPLEEGDEVVFLLTGVPAVPDNPHVNDWVQLNWLYNNGAAVGGEQVIAVPYTFQSVPAVYKNGLRLYKGLTTESYTADPDNQRILLTEPLATNDRLIVQIGGEAQVLEASDHTLQEVARAANVKDSEVILSTDTTQVLNGKKVIYDVVSQRIYGLPTLPTNVYIISVSDGQLTYSPGNITVTLLDSNQQQNTRELWRRSLVEAGLTLVDGSIEEGATANSATDAVWHIAGGQCYTWDGEFPKTVPAGSTPETSGGIGTGAWLSVGGATAVEYLNKLISFETPEKYGASSIFNPGIDDTPFVQAAIDAAEAPGGSGVVLLSRQYKLIDAPQTFKTPGDDGTVYPGWVGSGDDNLPAEDRPIQKFHLKILNGTKLIGLNRSCGFTGSWDPLTSPIAIEQPGMLLVTRAPGSSYLGTLTNHIANFTYSNFFVGIVFEGIIFQSRIEDLKPTSCGIAMIGHANENSVYRNIDFSNCYSGIVLGGWWNFRARVSGGNATTIYVPPYDGTGGNLMGWCDGADFYNIGFSVAVRLWGDRHENIDTWYGRYFYKNGNSALTSAGGRASNNTDSGDTATYSPFYGVASRAITILSRNGRGNGNNNVRKLRTNGTHRAPIFVNRSNRCTLQDAHVERSGWVDANTRSQVFGIDVQDPRRPAGFLQCTLAEGFIPLVGDYDMSASVSTKPLVPGGWRTRRSSTALDGSSGLIGSSSYPQQIVWAQDGAPYEKMLSRVRMQGNNAPDPVNGTDLYIKNTDYYRIPSIYVGSNAFTLQHSQGTFTPVLYVGATLVASTSASGFYERIGDTIRCTINWYNSSVDIQSLSGQVSIQGMPMPLTAHNGSNFPAITVGYLTAPNAYGITGSMSGTTLSLRKQNHTAHLTASDFTAGTVAHFLQLTVEYTVASVSP